MNETRRAASAVESPSGGISVDDHTAVPMPGGESLDEWIRRHTTGLGWVASDGLDIHGPFDDPVDALRRALRPIDDDGDFVTLSAVIERVDPVAKLTLSADGLLTSLYDTLSDHAPLGGLEDMPEPVVAALQVSWLEVTRQVLARWRADFPAHLPVSVWRASGDERLVTWADVRSLLARRRESA